MHWDLQNMRTLHRVYLYFQATIFFLYVSSFRLRLEFTFLSSEGLCSKFMILILHFTVFFIRVLQFMHFSSILCLGYVNPGIKLSATLCLWSWTLNAGIPHLVFESLQPEVRIWEPWRLKLWIIVIVLQYPASRIQEPWVLNSRTLHPEVENPRYSDQV